MHIGAFHMIIIQDRESRIKHIAKQRRTLNQRKKMDNNNNKKSKKRKVPNLGVFPCAPFKISFYFSSLIVVARIRGVEQNKQTNNSIYMTIWK